MKSMYVFFHSVGFNLVLGTLVLSWHANFVLADEAATSVVTQTPGLVAFWTFAEEPGSERCSVGTADRFPLEEVNGPIQRVPIGPYSGYSVRLDGHQYLQIPYAKTGALNICGPDAEVSMFSVVKLDDLNRGRTIAGMWNEGQGANDDSGTRQYGLLFHMPAYGGHRRLTPHISSEGGVTRRADGSAFPWCCDYAVSRHEVPEREWCTLGFTYDGEYIRAYINGKLDRYTLDPRRDKRTDRYFTKEGPDGKDRGMNPYYHGRGIFCYDAELHSESKPRGGSDFVIGARYAVGSISRHATPGTFAAVAVFNRALTDEEMEDLHQSADIEHLNQIDP